MSSGLKPYISVVLPTYNRARLIAGSVFSVLGQSFGDLELVIVDDGSTDDTATVVAGFADPRVRYIRRERNGGVAAARNTGVQVARGQYLAFQDSDDEWLPAKLELQLADLKGADGHTMAVCGLSRDMRSPGSSERAGILAYPRLPSDWAHGLDHRGVLECMRAYTQTWLVPRQAVLDTGGFDERFRIWDDWDLLIRLTQRLAVRTRTEPLVNSGRSQDSLSLDGTRFEHDLGLLLDKYAIHLQDYRRAHSLMRLQYAYWLERSGHIPEARTQLLATLRLRPWWPTPWRRLFRQAFMA